MDHSRLAFRFLSHGCDSVSFFGLTLQSGSHGGHRSECCHVMTFGWKFSSSTKVLAFWRGKGQSLCPLFLSWRLKFSHGIDGHLSGSFSFYRFFFVYPFLPLIFFSFPLLFSPFSRMSCLSMIIFTERRRIPSTKRVHVSGKNFKADKNC